MIGIYKITSPSGKVYIGQSVNLDKRKGEYRRMASTIKSQLKLYNSLVKYGFSEHIFEVVEECEVELLNARERHWQDFYNVVGEGGLNCRLQGAGDRSGKLSKETIERMRGPKCPRSEEHIVNHANSVRGLVRTEEQRAKSKGPRGPQKNPSGPRGPYSEERRATMRVPRGPMSEEHKESLRVAAKNRKKKV
jgi:group I intron endonuclease